MSIKILSESKHVEYANYNLFFERRDCRGSGWAPKCDEQGNVDEANMPAASLNTWEKVKPRLDSIRAGNDAEFFPPYIQNFTNRYKEPAIGLCPCGSKVSLGDFTNECECGSLYNWAGQSLAPRDQWEESY